MIQNRPTLIISPNTNWNPSSLPSNRQINVTSTGTWRVTVDRNARGWLRVSGDGTESRRDGNGSFRINVTHNTAGRARIGTITIEASGAPTRTITVRQARPLITLTRSTWQPVGDRVSSTMIGVTSQTTPWRVRVANNSSSWLSVQRNPNSFTITARRNPLGSSRIGTIIVEAPGAIRREVTVTQQAGPVTLTINPNTDWTVPVSGNSRTVRVTANVNNWTVSAPTWITVRRIGNDQFEITAPANPSATSRSGTVTVTAPRGPTRRFNVTQGGATTLTINNRPPNNRMQLGIGSRTLTANRAVIWRVANEDIARITIFGVLTPRRVGSTAVIATCTNTGQTARFTLTVDPLLLYQSPRLPGLNEDGSIADDMRFNNWTQVQLEEEHWRLGDMAIMYSSREVGGPNAVFATAQSLVIPFARSSSSMRSVAQIMFQRFFDGHGNDFHNTTLTNNVFDHASTRRFIATVELFFINHLINNGNFRNIGHIQDRLNHTRPNFTGWLDRLNGMSLVIHDTWGNNIELVEFRQNDQDITIRVRITIYDNFGLDSDDTHFMDDWWVEEFAGASDGFAAWYVLQHYSGTNNRHTPFISYFTREFTFTTTPYNSWSSSR